MSTVGRMSAAIQGWLRQLLFWIFYRTPMELLRSRGLHHHHLEAFYVYTSLVRTLFYVFPWIFLLIWYLTVYFGCGSSKARPYLDSLCMRPYLGPHSVLPWYLDYWDTSSKDIDTLDTLSPSNEALMIGYLDIHDAIVALRLQVSDLVETSDTKSHELLGVLNQVIALASDLAPQLDSCADVICVEKDSMNYAIRSFVDFYARIITTSTYQDLSILTFAIFPWWVVIGFLNQLFLFPWLPQPQLYAFQVEAEIRYQKQLLVDLSIASLDSIDKGCLSTRNFPHLAGQIRLLEAAIEQITNYKQTVKQSIDQSRSFWDILGKPERIVTLEKFDTLSQGIFRRIQKIRDIGGIYEAHYQRIRTHFRQINKSIHNSPSFEFSPTGVLATPEPLDPYIQKTSFLIRQQTSNTDHNGSGGGNVTEITPHPHVFFYDLNSVDGTPIATLRSVVAQLCKDSRNVNIVSGVLYMTCIIQALAAKISDLDDHNLGGGIQISWVVERQKAIRRHREQKGFDEESIIDKVLVLHRAYQDGAPVPDHL